jgi:hypothetical protein
VLHQLQFQREQQKLGPLVTKAHHDNLTEGVRLECFGWFWENSNASIAMTQVVKHAPPGNKKKPTTSTWHHQRIQRWQD